MTQGGNLPMAEPKLEEKMEKERAFDAEEKLHLKRDEESGQQIDLEPSIISTAGDLATEIVPVTDDPTLNPWTFRTWFLGLALTAFAATMTTISHFKPQPVRVNLVFLGVLSYVLGRGWEKLLPSKGRIGRFLNPHSFNLKEQTAIVLMAGAGATTGEPMIVLAVQKLWYNMRPTPIVGMGLLLSAQLIGYGFCGLLRSSLVNPTKMLYPPVLPVATLLNTFHQEKRQAASRMKIFLISFVILFVWQTFPSYIIPVLAGVSIFCLSRRNSLVFTRIFGGSMANEGLGIFSVSFDWQMIAGEKNPLWVPLQTLANEFGGYIVSIGLYLGLYYGNKWNAQNLPFLSPMLFSNSSTPKKYIPYDGRKLLNEQREVDPQRLEALGLPWFTASTASSHTTTNIAIAATVSHMLLWHYQDLKGIWSFLSLKKLKMLVQPHTWNWKFWKSNPKQVTKEEAESIDGHYALMLSYKDIPMWWFTLTGLIFITIGLICIHVGKTTLPWWAFFIAIAIGAFLMVFFTALKAVSGFEIPGVVFIQMVGAYIIPRKPIANMYFAAYGFNSLQQGKHMLEHFKLAQYTHLEPRCTFVMQVTGTFVGCIISYVVMDQITTTKREVLMAIEGNNVWSGQALQDHNALAIAWGGLAQDLFSAGRRYQMIPLAFLIGVLAPIPFKFLHKYFSRSPSSSVWSYMNVAIITGALANLAHGTHSSFLAYYVIGFFSQFYLRRYKPHWFNKYNYILSAGMDGGTAVINFILTFAVFGAGGKAVPFPPYWGNAFQRGNYDYCMKDPGE